jgi:NAD(P)-dependent dehydrogenase (short-subunit alcohol dehydrogenase family)
VALITGGGHGIGRATALRLAREGAAVAVVDVDAARADETVSAIRSCGSSAEAYRADVSSPQEVAQAVASATEVFGAFDIVHSNAGVLFPGSVVDQSLEEWERSFAVNVRGAYLVVRATLPAMLQRRRGTIVFTASTSGLVGEPGLAAYDASKAALVNLTRQLAAEYSSGGIRINCVCPGWIETGFNDPALAPLTDADVQAMVEATVPMRRQGGAEEIAAAVAFLASEDASYITGHALVVDGGLTTV